MKDLGRMMNTLYIATIANINFTAICLLEDFQH